MADTMLYYYSASSVISQPRLSESSFIQTHKSLQFLNEFHCNLQDGGYLVLYCDLYFHHLYVTCFLHTNSIHASANVRSTERAVERVL